MGESVLKFGGSSLSSARNVELSADIIVDHYLSNSGLTVVASAVGTPPGSASPKLTDRVLRLAESVYAGGTHKDAQHSIAEIGQMHFDIAVGLRLDPHIYGNQLRNLELVVADAILRRSQGGEINLNQLKDAMAQVGESSSTPILAAVVQQKLEKRKEFLEARLAKGHLRHDEQAILNRLQSAGEAYTHVVQDPGKAGFITDSHFTQARLLDSSLDTEIGRHHLSLRAKNRGRILFYPGFIAMDEHGNRTTLGRDGSNITTTALGAAINADKIIIYSDTDGVLLVSPKIVPDSQTARTLWHREVVLQAQYGGMKVLEDVSLYPLFRKSRNIPIHVRNTFNPNDPGTLITHESDDSRSMMKSIGIIPAVQYREFIINDFSQYQSIEAILKAYPGVRIIKSSFEANGNSPTAMFVIGTNPALERDKGSAYFTDDLFAKIKKEAFGGKTPHGLNYTNGSLISIVGKGLGNSLSDRAKIYSILDSVDWGGISDKRYKLPFWTTEDSIHISAKTDNASDIVKSLYNQLKRVNIVLYGLGTIGPAFLQKAIESYDELDINVIGVVDTSGGYGKIGGFTTKDLEAIIAAKKQDRSLKDASEQNLVERGVYLLPEQAKNFRNLKDFGKGDVVLVDATPDASMIHRQTYALHLGAKVISVNKAPYAVENNGHAKRQIPQLFEALFGNRLFNRGTVGANIGVPGKLLDILAKNPDYVTIRGCASGTLGYTTTLIEEGKLLSEGVQSAIDRGFTEPNPYKDYSGTDVLNKMLVLWRTIATKYGLDPFKIAVAHESYLAPAIRKYQELTGRVFDTSDLSGLTKKEFAERMKLLDQPFTTLQNALPDGHVFRYIGEISYDEGTKQYAISVGLREVHKTNSLGSLKGPDNRILFGINGSPDDPQDWISGKGAGIEETASAIMNDLKEIVALARGEYEGRKIEYERRPQPKRHRLPMVRWHEPSQKAAALLEYSGSCSARPSLR